MKTLVPKRIFFFIYVNFILRCLFVECSQHIMQLPDDILTYIGRCVFMQCAPAIIFDPTETNKDQRVLADAHSVNTVLNNGNNDFYALKNTNKKLCFLLNIIIKRYRDDIMTKAKNTVVGGDNFFTYCVNNNIQITDENHILLTRFYKRYQIPLKSNWFIKLCGLKPTFQETVQGNCTLHKSSNQQGLYLKIDFYIKNNIGPSFMQTMFQRADETSWRIGLLIQLLNDKGGMLEKLYPYLEFFKMFQYNGTDLGRESSFKCQFNLKEKYFTDSMKIKRQYVLTQKYSIPISKIPIDVFLECIKNTHST